MPLATLALLAALASSALAQTARTLLVGPGREYPLPSAAAAVAQAGDTILIDPGDYHADVCAWRADDLIIRAADPATPVRLFADDQAFEAKAIWVVKGAGAAISGIEFIGCHVPDNNGAGIRLEGPGLTLDACTFRQNQTGLLTGASAQSDVVIDRCEFVGNGAGDGFSHNIYIGHIRSLTIRASWSHDARVGHTLKSRAESNTILFNRFDDSPAGTSSYLIDLPNGGRALVMGNLLLQGPDASNGTTVSYGREGLTNADNQLFLVSNTLASDRFCQAAIRTQDGLASALIANNIVVNATSTLAGPGTLLANLEAPTLEAAGLDPTTLHPLPNSPAINAGVDLAAFGPDLAPTLAYLHPLATAARHTRAPIDAGAYELGPRTAPPKP